VGGIEAIDLQIAESLLGVRPDSLQLGRAIDGIDSEAEPIDLIVDRQFHRRIDVALLFVTAHVEILMVGAAVGQAVNQSRIAVEIENHRAVHREQGIEVAVAQTVRMLRVGLQLEQVHHVNEADLDVGELLAQ
jgi:hypothetical protein